MTLVLVPAGRGRWHTVEVRFNGRRSPSSPPMFPAFKVGQRYDMDGKSWRIAEVRT